MTLIVAITTRHSIWMLADRRLTYQNAPPRDDACKLMRLETRDGVGIIGYAGLGMTSKRVQPSEWMSRVLRGRNELMAPSIDTLARAAVGQIPKHLAALPPNQRAHNIVAPVFLNGRPITYFIDLFSKPSYLRTSSFSTAGSGAAILEKDKSLLTSARQQIKAFDQKKIAFHTVADRLAEVNLAVHKQDNLVGPKCIVLWASNKKGVHEGTGQHQYYDGTIRDDTGGQVIPTIANGTDVAELSGRLMNAFIKQLERRESGGIDVMLDEDLGFENMPLHPDETLD